MSMLLKALMAKSFWFVQQTLFKVKIVGAQGLRPLFNERFL
ncbi:MAG: hypothetical protein RIG66_29255 [Coleofasciculus sp. E2-BRE-01]